VNQMILQGALLVVALLVLPGGVVPALASMGRGLWRRVRPAPAAPPSVAEPAPDGPADTVRKPPGPEAETVLQVDDLAVTFGGLKALDGVSVSVRKGEVLAIIGPNGAGKTTLVNALSGLLPSGSVAGSARYQGYELIGRRATRHRARGLARTFQHAELFGELTAIENLLCTHRRLTAARRFEAARTLERLGLSGIADRRPAELPFGPQKRLDLARAVVEHPDLLILDEPFGGLDATERALLAAQVRRLRDEGTSMIIIDHVIEDLFAVADRVVAFDFGQPIGSGTPDVVLDDEVVRASYLGASTERPRRSRVPAGGDPLVTLTGVGHRYGGVVALDGVDLQIRRGAVLAVAGANGAGKSTLGQVVHGSIVPTTGARSVGEIDGRAPRSSLVPEGRALFKTLSVRENLEVAAYAAGVRGRELRRRLDGTLDWLPERVRGRLSVSAAALSGGEQQLLATARALMAAPDLLVLDEPALGLAPALVDEVYARISGLAERGLTVVVLEQLLTRAIGLADEVVVLHEGVVALHGAPDDPDFAARAERAYFAGAPAALPLAGTASS
jgi:branched-chain amino acid transport system ATP-binding protein